MEAIPNAAEAQPKVCIKSMVKMGIVSSKLLGYSGCLSEKTLKLSNAHIIRDLWPKCQLSKSIEGVSNTTGKFLH